MWPPIPEECETPVLMVTGKTDEAVGMVLINGQPFPVVDGDFSIVWRLEEGRNDTFVEAWDAAGNHASLGHTVLYSDGPPGLRLLVPRGSDGPSVHVRGTTDANVGMVWVDGVPASW